MAKNKQRLSFEANLSRHPHDISAGYTASMSTGAIIPQWFDVAQPGDKYIFKTTMFARLQNISKAFLGEIDLHVKYFFVPLSMLYTPFGQIFAQTNDVLSSFLRGLKSVDTFPMYDVDSRINSTPNSGFYAGHKECYGKENARLLDAFNLNPYAVLSSQQRNFTQFDPAQSQYTPIDLMQTHNPKISPWILGAYQAIYQKFFRNDEQEKFVISAYNFDYHFEDVSFDDAEFFKLRYCQRPADYFTKLRVSPIASFINKLNFQETGNNVVAIGDGGDLGYMISKVSDFLGQKPFNRTLDSSRTNFNYNNEDGAIDNPSGVQIGSPLINPDSNDSYYTNVANIRAAFALDKFLRVYGRAGKTYDEQILAHFGIKIPHDVKHDATEICHFHNVIQADPVYGTATIGNDKASVLGQVGGQAAGTLTGSEQKFVAPVHGVIMAVAYAVTKPRYYGTFSKLHLLGSRIDFPIPEFDKLGAQPMYNFEINPHALVNNEAEGGFTLKTDRMGWQNRYQQFKEKYNRLSFTYAPADAFGQSSVGSYSGENEFMPWVLSRKVFDSLSDGTERTPFAYELWESPLALNPIMDIPLSPEWSNDYYFAPHLMFQTDPIITEFYCDCTKVSWMSPTGEPDL